MYFFSLAGAWTRTASASPFSAMVSAAPVPTAITFVSIPVCFWKSGIRTSNSPLSWVLVVVARIIEPPIFVGEALELPPPQAPSASAARTRTSRGRTRIDMLV